MSPLSTGTRAVTVAGTRVVYHVAGTGPVMIAHSGGPGVGSGYLRSAALEKRFTMVYPEPPGTGESDPLPEGASYVETYVDFLHALVEHLDVPQVYLLGHSHGGFVAQRFALRYPDRVAGLALYSTSPMTGPEFSAAVQKAILAYPQRHPDVPETAEVVAALAQDDTGVSADEKSVLLRQALPIYFADFWGRRRPEFEELRNGVYAWPQHFATRVVDYRDEVSAIQAPTVIVTGRHDFICGPVWAQMLFDRIPGSRLVILENSGHFAQQEEPEAFLEAVTSLLP